MICLKFLQEDSDFLESFSDCERIVLVADINSPLESDKVVYNGKNKHFIYDKSWKTFNKRVDLSSVKGVVIHYLDDKELCFFEKLFNYSLIYGSAVENCETYYAYTNKYKDFIIVNGKKINAQLAKTESGWILGFPTIITGF